MGNSKKFIFASEKRAKILFKAAKIFAGASIVFVLLLVNNFITSPSGRKFPSGEKTIVDEISTKDENKISLEGTGPIFEVSEIDGQHNIRRTETPVSKTVFLTFDDGPDALYTRRIIKILEAENVKGTFFLVGEHVYKNPEIAKELVEGGHSIGLHTFTHEAEEVTLYGKDTRMYLEFEMSQKVIEKTTGYNTRIFRVPYVGAEDTIDLNSLVLAVNASQRGYATVGVTVDTSDWQAKNVEEVMTNIKERQTENPVVLLHDGGGDRDVTVSALPEIIKFYKEQGYAFTDARSLFPNEQVLAPISKREAIFATSAVYLYSLYANFPKIISNLFIFGLLAFGLHSILISILAIAGFLKSRNFHKRLEGYLPRVSVIIPAFNEEKVIAKTIRSIIGQNYKNLEVIVVNDGSTDSTEAEIQKFSETGKIIDVWQLNQGKAAALNTGISRAAGEIIVIVDADTQILPYSIENLVARFNDPKVGAVCGNVKVGNIDSMLTALQEIDYRMAINLERRAFDFLNSIFVIPGAIGAWRKKAVRDAGWFSNITLTEDAELGMKIRKLGYKIVYEPDAIGLTEAPISVDKLIRQRFRWTFGILQTLWLHKEVIFNRRYGIFGLVVVPYIVFVQIPTMMIAPLVEIAAIPLAIFVSAKLVLVTLVLLLASRIALFVLASKLGGEKLTLLPYILPYRFIFQFLWYFVFNAAVFTAIKGSLVAWKKLPHFGLVKIENYSG